jgi:RNase adapter protein RapZ
MAPPKKIPQKQAAPKNSVTIKRPPEKDTPGKPAPRHVGAASHADPRHQLVILTGLSGSGKASALKAFEDLGYYAVDNLPIDLLTPFAELVAQSVEITRAALVVDVREGQRIERFPTILRELRKHLSTTVIYLEASKAALLRRFSETRRPHPLGREAMVAQAIQAERTLLDPVRNVADILIDTSNFNVHELRAYIQDQFQRESVGKSMLVSAVSFGYKNGVPLEADLVFDVRFLPNPHFVPEFRHLTGRHPKVIAYIRKFKQTQEFLDRVTDLLLFLLPNYIHEGKSYLTVAFGCTGGQHRSVMIAEEIRKRLAKEGYRVKTAHRDMPRT